jgi:hypothetical protein
MGVGNEIAVDSRLDQQPTKHWTWCSVGSGVHTDSQASQSETCCQASVIVNARGNTLVLVASRRNASKALQGNPTRVVLLSRPLSQSRAWACRLALSLLT